MKHKNAEVLHAFADGIECEYWCNYNKVWRTFVGLTIFEMDVKVRIKPEPQKEQEPHIENYEKVLKAYRELVEEQDKKICELVTKLAYANQTIENLTVDEPPKEYLYVYNDANRRESWMSPTLLQETYGWNYMGKVEVEK